ncbi:MAG: hypothetical protein JNK58_11160 [Phycisphaerae bacterium]|nr:hypothetical protein [Phycisphaerae bacterium]
MPAAERSMLDQVRRGVLWAMVASLSLGGLLGAGMLLGGVGDATAWRVESTLFGLALHCGASLGFFHDLRAKTLAWRAMLPLTICCANFLILLGSTWITNDQEQAWGQTGVLLGVAALLAPAWTLFRKGSHRSLGFLCVLACASAGALTLIEIWTQSFWSYRPTWEKMLGTSWSVAIALALIAALFAWRAQPRLRWLRIVVTILICVGTALIIGGIVENSMWEIEFYRRLTVVFSILSVCGVLINAILARLFRPEAEAGSRAAIDIEVRCPTCRENVTLPTGRSSCPFCKTRFEMRVVPGACIRCGYDLASLREPTCPECGTVY